MADFFDQICKVLAENGKKYPGQVADSPEIRKFFSRIEPESPVPQSAPVTAEPEPPVPQSAPVTAVPQPQVPQSAPVTAVPEPQVPQSAPVTAVPQPQVPQSAPAIMPQAGSMAELQAAMANCCRCDLHRTRKNIVFGEGNLQAKLMFIGEGPGFYEDCSGRPFVGDAGKLLDKMITAMQFTREEVYIANIVKCRPPNNRNPLPAEAACCLPFLKQQIDLIRPEVIVLLGAVAVKYLLGATGGIREMRGKWTSYENIPVLPTFHPAYLLREKSAKRDAWKDLQLVMARFGKFHRN